MQGFNFYLAGVVGIEPTPKESEAFVLPLHHTPPQKALYSITVFFATVLYIYCLFFIFLIFVAVYRKIYTLSVNILKKKRR